MLYAYSIGLCDIVYTRPATFPVDRLRGVPGDFVDQLRRWVVDSHLDFDAALKLLDLRQTSPVTTLVKHHRSLHIIDVKSVSDHFFMKSNQIYLLKFT